MCYIFVNGFIEDYELLDKELEKGAYIIACDGGLKHIHKLNLVPNILIGDFDSVSSELLEQYKDIKRLTYPTDKDYTDTELALKFLYDEGVKTATLYGATGGRLDHTIGNIYLLKKAYEYGLDLKIVDNLQEIYFVKELKRFSGYKDKYLSILPLEDVTCDTSIGLKYQLKDLKLTIGDTLSISNIITDDFVEVKFKSGCGIIFINKHE